MKIKGLFTHNKITLVTDKCKRIYCRTWKQPYFLTWNKIHAYSTNKGEWYLAVNAKIYGITFSNVIVKCHSEKQIKDWIWNAKYSKRLVDTIKEKSKYQTGDKLSVNFKFIHENGEDKFKLNNKDDYYYDTNWS